MTKMLTYLKPYWRQVLLGVILVLVEAMSNLYLPNLNAAIVNNGIARGDMHYILRTGGFMLLVTFLLGVCAALAVYNSSKVAMAVGRDLRGDVFRKVQSFSQAQLNQFGISSLITRTTNDVQQVQMAVLMGMNVMLFAPFMAIGSIIMALQQDVTLSWSIVFLVPVMGALLALNLRRVVPLFKLMQVKIDRLNQVVREKLNGVRVIRAFVKSQHEEKRFGKANADLTNTALEIQRHFALFMPLQILVINMANVVVTWVGSHRVDTGAMPIGNLTAFLTYIMHILFSVMISVMMLSMIPRASASAARIMEVLDVEPEISDPLVSSKASDAGSGVEFHKVEFAYPGAQAPVLKDITFAARPGQVTAIIGSTGSGKSTLVNLLPRLYEVTGGRILVNGRDIRDMPVKELRDLIGYVPQKAFLFSGTIASNLRYGRENATDEELWRALSIAQAADFVRAMSGELNAPVAQGGTNLSGGQRQRLAIARALVKRPLVYIFDDSFSALDFRTDAALRQALMEEVKEAVVLIVAQRVSTIMNADQILVLDQGRIVGIGTHAQLIEQCEVYREIVRSQLGEDEVA
ncbi:MAG: ABC transporter ATP-binding protein [Firmicutes bacterium]|nr:ABC transporter ATP-binding protein [Bacillota bacterium]